MIWKISPSLHYFWFSGKQILVIGPKTIDKAAKLHLLSRGKFWWLLVKFFAVILQNLSGYSLKLFSKLPKEFFNGNFFLEKLHTCLSFSEFEQIFSIFRWTVFSRVFGTAFCVFRGIMWKETFERIFVHLFLHFHQTNCKFRQKFVAGLTKLHLGVHKNVLWKKFCSERL